MYALNAVNEDSGIQLKEKFNAYSNNVREVYMSLQGETNVVAAQASKAVRLVAKHLFNKDISEKDLPCRRTCLNFTDEANHIAKQHIVETIQTSTHFVYGSDGTSRQKKHFMEHHIVLDNGATLSVGYSEVPDDKADTLLEKSVDLMDELSDVYGDGEDKSHIFLDILKKRKGLMGDRAANMKLFNKKMLQYKKDIVGDDDAALQFLYCNAHFLIALASATEKAVKIIEDSINERLGRDRSSTFNRFSQSAETSASRLIRTISDVLGPRGDEKNGCREDWLAHCSSCGITSKFTSYRSNRFNNLFENAFAVILHKSESLEFFDNKVSHSNLKLQSICLDLLDDKIMSMMTAISFFSTFVTTPYWNLMNSKVPYGQFPAHVRAMKEALQQWSQEEFTLFDLQDDDNALFGNIFFDTSTLMTTRSYFSSGSCDKELTSATFRMICQQSLEVLNRQLVDFLPGGVYGEDLPTELQKFLDTCPLTNLSGERLFGDLDFDMIKRKTASTFLHSTISMWKHNKTSSYLDQKTPEAKQRIMSSARKHGKDLKRRHKIAVQEVREVIKNKLEANHMEKKEKEIKNKERQAALLNDLLLQGGWCDSKEDLYKLMRGPQPLQKLKVEMRFRKYYSGASNLRLTGNLSSLYAGLCNHLGFDYDEPPQKRRKSDDDTDNDECYDDNDMETENRQSEDEDTLE